MDSGDSVLQAGLRQRVAESGADRVDTLLLAGLKGLYDKPALNSSQATKRKYSQDMSGVIAVALAEEFRLRGLPGTKPAGLGETRGTGAERRLAGGIGAKKVDVSWTTEESGLLLGASVKTINWRDGNSKNFQKNLTNRREALLFESVTLHRRFPYAVLGGFMFLDKDARNDGTARRNDTFSNAFTRLRLFTGRFDPAGREEQYERLDLLLVDATPFGSTYECYEVDKPGVQIPLSQAFDELIMMLGERNFDSYETYDKPDGKYLRKLGR